MRRTIVALAACAMFAALAIPAGAQSALRPQRLVTVAKVLDAVTFVTETGQRVALWGVAPFPDARDEASRAAAQPSGAGPRPSLSPQVRATDRVRQTLRP